MVVWNIKQTIMKNYNVRPINERSAIDFASSFYFAQLLILFSALSIVFFALRLLVTCTTWCSEPCLKTLEWKQLCIFFNLSVICPSNKSGLGKSWQIVDFMFTFEVFSFLNGLSIKRTLVMHQWCPLYRNQPVEFNQRY